MPTDAELTGELERERTHPARRRVDDHRLALAQPGRRPQQVPGGEPLDEDGQRLAFADDSVVLSMVAHGMGMAVVPRLTAADAPPQVAADLTGSEPPPTRTVGYVTTAGLARSTAVRDLVGELRALRPAATARETRPRQRTEADRKALAMAIAPLTGGRLGDMFGRKRVLLAGTAGFTLTSLACATAVSPEMLIVARLLQGASGAVMIPQGFGLTKDLFPGEEIKKAWGIFGPLMGLSAVLGPIVAGLLISADVFGTGWRMIFGINLPIGIFAFVMGRRYLPDVAPSARTTRLDLPDVLLAAVGAFLLVFPLVQGRELGWPLWVKAMLAASLPVLAGFARYQVLRKRSGRTPLIEPSVFTKRAYVSGVVFAIAFAAAMGGTIPTLGLFLQVGLGYSALHSSLTTAPWALGALFGSAFGGMRMQQLGRRVLHLGLLLMGGGMLALYGVFQWAGAGITQWDFTAPLLVGGAGMGMIFVPLFDIILSGVDGHEMGSASGALQALQQLGFTPGIAILGTLFFAILGDATPGTATHVAAALDGAKITALCTVGVIAAAFLIGFWLPNSARTQGNSASAEAAERTPEPAVA